MLESSLTIHFFKLAALNLNIIIFVLSGDYEGLTLFWNVYVNLPVFKHLVYGQSPTYPENKDGNTLFRDYSNVCYYILTTTLLGACN